MKKIIHFFKHLFRKLSLRAQLILFSLLISFFIGGIAFFVLRFNNATLSNDSEFLDYISKINTLYQLQEENSKLLYEILENPDSSSKTSVANNVKLSYQLLEEIEYNSPSVNSSLRIRVATYLLKRFEKHVEEMTWLRNYDDSNQIATSSSYYEMYLRSGEILARINSYLQEILRFSVEENQEFIRQSKQDNQKLQTILISFVLLILFGSIGAYLFFADYITKLIRNISAMTNHIAKGNKQKGTIALSGPREIEELTKSFNELLSTIYSLNQEAEDKAKLELLLSEEERKKTELELCLAEEELAHLKYQELLKESQLQGLQLQIKPHFLFNTLNVISMTALLENAQKAHELIITLSKFMRHSLKEVRNKVPLSEEIDMISQYLMILKARMGEQLLYRIVCPDSIKSITIPMFTLQPIVENAFKHGIEDKIEQGFIMVRIKYHNNVLVLSVYDNGNGMDLETLTKIKQKLLPHPVDFGNNSHIGIENVGYRLNMFYEANVRYVVSSSHKRGTIFTIQIQLEEGATYV